MRITEWELVFGEYDAANCFHIEKTDIYKDLSRKGIKSVEFLLYQPEKRKLLLVEGKNTLPSENKKEVFEEEIMNISCKFMDSLQLACGIWFGGHNKKVKIPKNGKDFFRYGVQIVFVLVIKKRDGKLTDIADIIKQQLLQEHRLWKFEVLVLNENQAYRKGLVVLDNNLKHG